MSALAAAKAWLLPHIALTRGPDDALYLTFDNGPDPRFTGAILDVLDHYRVKATFFVIGKALAMYPDLAADAARRGHRIGGHSFAHRDLRTLSRAEIDADIAQLDALARFRLYRPPYGGLSVSALLALYAAKKRIVMWSRGSCDSFTTTPEEVVAALAPTAVQPGDIILMHDNSGVTLHALPTVLQNLIGAGFRFALLPQ